LAVAILLRKPWKTRAGRSRIGYTVSNKVGHAVVRNRIRRRLREIYCLHERQIDARV